MKVQLCDSAGNPPVLPADEGWIMEKKFDGWRFLWEVTEAGIRAYGGRNGSDHSGKAREVERVLSFLPVGTVLDGELLAPDGPSTRVAAHLANGGDLYAVIFDVLAVAGTDVTDRPWAERRQLLEKAAEGFDGERVRLSEVHEIDEELYRSWVEAGEEGAVVKRTRSVYRQGRRSKDWLKLKPQTTDEARVTGFRQGKGSWADGLGTFEIQMLESGASTTCAIPTDAMRREVTADPEAFLGRILELAHHGLQASGKPRHPVFSHWREDRDEEPKPAPKPAAPKPAPRDKEGYTDSPCRSGAGRIRNLRAMGDAKFAKLCREMEGSEDVEGLEAVRAEERRRAAA